MGNAIDELVSWFSPLAALRRKKARYVMGAYEAASPSRLRKYSTDSAAPNVQVQRGAAALRVQARNLEQNHDIARGILRTMVNNVVGPKGIGVEPQPRRDDGSIHTEYAAALLEVWRDWQRVPEVTHRHHWAKMQRMVARTWFRDGEGLAQTLIGAVPFLDHGTRVPFSLEMFEPDMIPISYDEQVRNIRQGIQRNAWGRPTGYWVYKTHPGELFGLPTQNDLKFIPAANILHIALLDRIGQLRGVSEFASVITRLEDIKDYEESERVAAKIAARLTGYIKRGAPDMFDPEHDARNTDETGKVTPREIAIQMGTIVDSLSVGEEMGLFDTQRPNPNLVTFRQGQLRAIAAGVGAGYSSISRDYDGSYSSQRQELVEQWVNYAVLTDEFTGQFVQPVWESFVMAAHLSGVVPIPRDIKPGTHDDALYLGQSMPWIDPIKEASAWIALVRAGFASEVEVMRKRGVNPHDVMEQISTWRKQVAVNELVFDSDARVVSKNGAAQPEPTDPAVAAAWDSIARAVAGAAESNAATLRDFAALHARAASPEIHVHANIDMPDQPAPVMTVADGAFHVNVPAPVVSNHIHVPEQPAPQIDVHVEAVMPDQPAPVIHVKNEVQPAEIREVKITAMPDRETTSTVERDSKGNIVKTRQTEQDT